MYLYIIWCQSLTSQYIWNCSCGRSHKGSLNNLPAAHPHNPSNFIRYHKEQLQSITLNLTSPKMQPIPFTDLIIHSMFTWQKPSCFLLRWGRGGREWIRWQTTRLGPSQRHRVHGNGTPLIDTYVGVLTPHLCNWSLHAKPHKWSNQNH